MLNRLGVGGCREKNPRADLRVPLADGGFNRLLSASVSSNIRFQDRPTRQLERVAYNIKRKLNVTFKIKKKARNIFHHSELYFLFYSHTSVCLIQCCAKYNFLRANFLSFKLKQRRWNERDGRHSRSLSTRLLAGRLCCKKRLAWKGTRLFYS